MRESINEKNKPNGANVIKTNETKTNYYYPENVDMQTETKILKEIEIQSESPYHEVVKVTEKGKVKIDCCDNGVQTNEVVVIPERLITNDGEVQTTYEVSQETIMQTETNIVGDGETQTQCISSDIDMQTELKEFKDNEVQSESPYQEVIKATSKGKIKIVTCDDGAQTKDVTVIEGKVITDDEEIQTIVTNSQEGNTQTEPSVLEEKEAQTKYYSVEDMDMQTEKFTAKEIESQTTHYGCEEKIGRASCRERVSSPV